MRSTSCTRSLGKKKCSEHNFTHLPFPGLMQIHDPKAHSVPSLSAFPHPQDPSARRRAYIDLASLWGARTKHKAGGRGAQQYVKLIGRSSCSTSVRPRRLWHWPCDTGQIGHRPKSHGGSWIFYEAGRPDTHATPRQTEGQCRSVQCTAAVLWYYVNLARRARSELIEGPRCTRNFNTRDWVWGCGELSW